MQGIQQQHPPERNLQAYLERVQQCVTHVRRSCNMTTRGLRVVSQATNLGTKPGFQSIAELDKEGRSWEDPS